MAITRAPKTIVVYDITGQTDYTIPFEYLARKFVVVTLIGQDRKVLTLNTDYRFTTKTTIGLSDPNPAGYNKIELRRFTSATDRLVDFHDGSILRAYDLNLSQIQTLHVAEEARDLAGDSIAVDDNGDLDARGRKIVNLGDAILDTDAVNLGMLKKFDDSTYNNAQLAEASANDAGISENNAKNSEIRCLEAESKSVASAGTAMTAAADANKSKVAAEAAEATVVPLVPTVEQASKDAAEAATKAEQAVQDVKDLGAVPVGMIVMFGHKAVPAGYLDLCVPNPTFDILEYPDLAKLYPNGILPSYLNKYPKGGELTTVGATGSWMIPDHTHETDISHGHSVSSTFEGDALPPHKHKARFPNKAGNTPYLGGTGAYSMVDTTSDSAGTPTGTVTTTLQDFSGTKVSTGIREALNKGNIVDVDHVKTTYAIKAAGKVSDEGLMEVTAIKADVAKNTQDISDMDAAYKAADAKILEEVRKYPEPWVIIGDIGAPVYVNGSKPPNEVSLRYRYIDKDTIHLIGTVDGSFNGEVLIFNFPSEIATRITTPQNAPCTAVSTDAFSNTDMRTIARTNEFVIRDAAVTGTLTKVFVNHTIILS